MNEVAWLSVMLVGLAIVGWTARRALQREGKRCPSGSGLYPECLYRVSISADEIQVANPDGNTSRVQLRSLTKIVVQTSDTGPWGTDLWWHWYEGSRAICSYPLGATGEDKALAFVQSLDGFSDDQLRSAMASTGNQSFVIYEGAA